MIKLSPKAKIHFENNINKENGVGIGIELKKSGCSGMAYHIFIFKEKSHKNYLLIDNEPKIFVNKKYEKFLNGLIIDIQEKGLSTNVVFVNPNEKNSCGCGESISF